MVSASYGRSGLTWFSLRGDGVAIQHESSAAAEERSSGFLQGQPTLGKTHAIAQREKTLGSKGSGDECLQSLVKLRHEVTSGDDGKLSTSTRTPGATTHASCAGSR